MSRDQRAVTIGARVRGRVLPIAVLFYMSVLVFGALDPVLTPDFLEGPQRRVHALQRRFHLFSGAALFSGNGADEYKQERLCPVVIGHFADGEERLLYRCPERVSYWNTNWYGHSIARVFETAHPQIRSDDTRQAVDLYTHLSDYFCHSKLEANSALEVVSLLLYQTKVSFHTGQRRRYVTFEYRWNCGDSTVPPRPWPDIGGLLASVSVEGAQ